MSPQQHPYWYEVFGLIIKSEFSLDGFIETEAGITVNIVVNYGPVAFPSLGQSEFTYEPNCAYNESCYFVKVPLDIAIFSVHQQGNYTEVFLDLKRPEEVQTAMAWFYGLVLSGILHLNNLFALHASGILHQEQLQLFCGASGIGKSTIAAQLKSRGYPLFTDDKCVLSWNVKENFHQASPGLKIMRLWENSIQSIKVEEFLTNPVPVVYKSKKQQFHIQTAALVKKQIPLKKIFILKRVSKENQLSSIPLTGFKKMRLLRQQIFRENMVSGFKKERVLWDFLQSLVSEIPVCLILRPIDTPISNFGDFMETQILKP